MKARAIAGANWRTALAAVALASACGVVLLAWLLPGHVAGWLLLSAFCA